MSIAIDAPPPPFTLTMLLAAVLSVATGFGGFGRPISAREVCMDVVF